MRLLPSQVADTLLEAFKNTGIDLDNAAASYPDFDHRDEQMVATVVGMVDAIPAELLVGDETTNRRVIIGRTLLQGFLDGCRHLGMTVRPVKCVVLQGLYQGLRSLPDRTVPSTVDPLPFLPDPALKASIRDDLSSVETNLRDADWKAATVMAGSAAEALLLWKIQTLQQADPNKVSAAIAKQISKPPSDLLEWDLHHLINVAEELGVIQKVTAGQLRVAKGFRNLIHPGRAQRLGEKCDRGTTYAAMAGLQFLIRDL